MATTVGSGRYQYELNESWAMLPTGWAWGRSARSRLARPRLRLPAPGSTVVVFDRNGTYMTSWGHSAFKDPLSCSQAPTSAT